MERGTNAKTSRQCWNITLLVVILTMSSLSQCCEARAQQRTVRRLAQALPTAETTAAETAPITPAAAAAAAVEPVTVAEVPGGVHAEPAPVASLHPEAAAVEAPSLAISAAAVTEPQAATETAAPVEVPLNSGTHSGSKLYLYAWCGVTYDQQDPAVLPNDNTDYVATIDATYGTSSFGKIVSITSTPYVGTEAHHCNVDKTGQYFAAGGLLSLLQPSTPDIFMFDVSNPARPMYKYGLTSKSGSCIDEFVPAPTGGFYATSMCGRDGHPGGGLVRIPDPSTPKLLEYTGGLTATQKKTFASHGIGVDYNSRRIVTADYLDVLSSVETEPQQPLNMMHTAHVWNMDTMKVIKTVNLSGITDGLMEARWSGEPGLFWVSGGIGKLHLIDTYTYKVTPNVYCLGDNCTDVAGTCLTTDIFPGRSGSRRMLVTSMSLAQVRLVDASNPRKLKTLDIYQLLEPGAGAHVVKYNKDTGIAAVATYLLDIKGTVLHFPSDQSVRLLYIDLSHDKIVPLGDKIDFKTAVPSKGSSNCHGLAFNYKYYY